MARLREDISNYCNIVAIFVLMVFITSKADLLRHCKNSFKTLLHILICLYIWAIRFCSIALTNFRASYLTGHPLLKRYNLLGIHFKLHLHKILIRPIFTYGVPIWNIMNTNNRKILQRTQDKILRYILGVEATRIQDTVTPPNIYTTRLATTT